MDHPEGLRTARIFTGIVAAALALAALPLAAQNADAASSGEGSSAGELLSKIASTGKAETRAYLGKGKARIALAPEGADLAYLGGELERAAPDVCVESLYAAPLPEAVLRLGPAERALAVANVLRSISTLKGIDYWSASRGKRRLLFAQAYCLASPESSSPVADPLRRELPASERVYAFMEDLTFGKNVYALDYRNAPGSSSLSILNLSPMKVWPVTAMAPECFRIILSVQASGDRVVVYALALAKAAAVPGMREKIQVSTANRVDSLTGWIKNGLSAPPSAPR